MELVTAEWDMVKDSLASRQSVQMGESLSLDFPHRYLTSSLRIVLPVALLALSAFLTLVSAVVLRNHQSLSESVGATGLNLSGKSKSGRKSALELLTNPFTMTVLVFSGGLAVSAMTIPG